MKKKFQIKNTKFFVKARKKIPWGIELMINIEHDKEKGKAFWKFFGPNSKNKYKLSINKAKAKDVKFVKILTNEIVKPLLDNFIEGKGIESIKSENIEDSTCLVCKKQFTSLSYVKIHLKNMHQQSSNDNNKVALPISSIKDVTAKCNQCTQTFKSSIDMNKHIENGHPQTSRNCDECDFKFT